jgi:hypothetical protein
LKTNKFNAVEAVKGERLDCFPSLAELTKKSKKEKSGDIS